MSLKAAVPLIMQEKLTVHEEEIKTTQKSMESVQCTYTPERKITCTCIPASLQDWEPSQLHTEAKQVLMPFPPSSDQVSVRRIKFTLSDQTGQKHVVISAFDS